MKFLHFSMIYFFLCLSDYVKGDNFCGVKIEGDNEEIVKKSIPINGHVSMSIGDTVKGVLKKSYYTNADIADTFKLFRGSPTITEGVSYLFDDSSYRFNIQYAFLINARSDAAGASRYDKYLDAKIRLIAVRKMPIYSSFDAAYQEALCWEKFFMDKGVKNLVDNMRVYSYEAAKIRADKELPGNKFPTFYVSAIENKDIKVLIGIDRSPNRIGPEKYGFNINIYIQRFEL